MEYKQFSQTIILWLFVTLRNINLQYKISIANVPALSNNILDDSQGSESNVHCTIYRTQQYWINLATFNSGAPITCTDWERISSIQTHSRSKVQQYSLKIITMIKFPCAKIKNISYSCKKLDLNAKPHSHSMMAITPN